MGISPISPKFGSLDPLAPKRKELPSVPPSAPYEAFNRIKGHPPYPPDQNAILTHLKAIFSRTKPISCHLRHVGTHFAHKKPYLFSKKKRKKPRLYPCLFLGLLTLISPISPKFGSLDPLAPKRQELPSVPPSAPYVAFNRIKGHPPTPPTKTRF